jgi:membrane-associated phospholipid phosphatase
MRNFKSVYKSVSLKALLLFVIFWAPVITFLKLAGEVVESQPLPLDIYILYWLHQHANTFLDHFFLAATNVGGIFGVLIITGVCAAYFIHKSKRHDALFLIMSVGGASLANLMLKALFHRDRPSLWHQSIIENSFSFPSGHAMASAALLASLVLIYWNTRARWYVLALAFIGAILVGLSRLYLGVHYPSDVLAGWCVSIVWVLLLSVLFKKLIVRFMKN